jgi:hypothetical protein
MKKSKFSDGQIMTVLQPAEAGIPVPELYWEHGISSATFYTWRYIQWWPLESAGRRKSAFKEDVC